ncbi:MAG: hypothetical protein J1G06_04565 [Oscillospiraceae bacterium]|nr:hypothetical protein [Oscillospiraceae bacterium]
MFKSKGILPDALAKQNPRLLFEMLDSVNDSSADEKSEALNPDELNEYERMFYGY